MVTNWEVESGSTGRAQREDGLQGDSCRSHRQSPGSWSRWESSAGVGASEEPVGVGSASAHPPQPWGGVSGPREGLGQNPHCGLGAVL